MKEVILKHQMYKFSKEMQKDVIQDWKGQGEITGSLKRQGILKFRYRVLKTSETDHRMFVLNFSIRFLIETSKNIAIDGRKCRFKVVY